MRGGKLTLREAEIIHQLLAKRGITQYEIIEATPEGTDLPGSTYDAEIETLSGYVVTATKVYLFWLDWFKGSYTLGEHDGAWREIAVEQLGADKDTVVEAQTRLRQRGGEHE